MRKNKFINKIIVCSMTVLMLTFASAYSVHAQDANYDTDMEQVQKHLRVQMEI